MTSLGFKQGDPKWKELRKRSLEDLFFFNAVVLGYKDLFPLEDRTHLIPHLFLSRRTGCPELDQAPMQLVMWPRETGKSSCGTVGESIQMACRNPNTAILVANEKQDTAADFIGAIENHFQTNEMLRALFPEVIPPDLNKTTWSATRATLRRSSNRPECTFDSIGVGGTVTGKHFDHIVCDDLISKEAMENARAGNWSVMQRVNRWVNQLTPLLSIGAKPFPTIRFIGTRWWHEDVYDHIEEIYGYGEQPRRFLIRAKLPSTGKIVSREAYRVGDLAVMRIAAMEDGNMVFPKIWSRDRYEKERLKDPVFVSCNLQNNPVDAAVRMFQDEWLHYWVSPDGGKTLVYDLDDGGKRFVELNQLVKLMVIDPAFTTNSEGSRSAIVVLGTDMETGKHLVLEAIAQHSEPKDTVSDIINTCKRRNVTRVFIESVAQQEAFIQFVQAEAMRTNTALAVDIVKPGGRNKDVRIETLSAYFKNFQLIVHKSHIDLLEEYTRFRPGALRKDLLDALAYALEKSPNVSRGIGAYGGDARSRSRLQLRTYHARRGLVGRTT